jgi:hypothetical protein
MTIKAIPGYEGLQPFLDAFAVDHPNRDNVFIAMRFRQGRQFVEIHQAIKTGLARYGLRGLRADDRVYPPDGDLWTNVCVYMLACKYAVCVFEEIDEREFNPNVPLEYGFMRALNRQVLLLKDRRMARLPTDMTGKVYHAFDSYNITETIQQEVETWVEKDLGISRIGEARTLMDSLPPNSVLVVGHFTQDRRTLYDCIRDELRRHGYNPSLHDSEGANADRTSVLSIARFAQFVIADVTDTQNLPQELSQLASNMPFVPIQPLLQVTNAEWENVEYFRLYRSALERLSLYQNVLEPILYHDELELLAGLNDRVIPSAETFMTIKRKQDPAAHNQTIRDI